MNRKIGAYAVWGAIKDNAAPGLRLVIDGTERDVTANEKQVFLYVSPLNGEGSEPLIDIRIRS
jgi:hypothetical protein